MLRAGGDCSAAYKGGAGQCCGNRNGVAFCCPHFTQGAKCAACVESYRCFSTARRPRDICAADGGDLRAPGADIEPNAVASLLIFVMFVASITCACVACARARRAQPMVTTVQMQPMGSQPQAGLPVGTAVPVGSVVAGQPVVHHHHGGYGGGGTVGMGAGMGFLGGMMMGEMIADAGHHGGVRETLRPVASGEATGARPPGSQPGDGSVQAAGLLGGEALCGDLVPRERGSPFPQKGVEDPVTPSAPDLEESRVSFWSSSGRLVLLPGG